MRILPTPHFGALHIGRWPLGPSPSGHRDCEYNILIDGNKKEPQTIYIQGKRLTGKNVFLEILSGDLAANGKKSAYAEKPNALRQILKLILLRLDANTGNTEDPKAQEKAATMTILDAFEKSGSKAVFLELLDDPKLQSRVLTSKNSVSIELGASRPYPL